MQLNLLRKVLYSYLERNSKYLVYIPLIIYWLILFILTSLPSGMAITTDVSDKINHFGAYGLLSVFLYTALHFQNKYITMKKYPAIFTVLIASFYGALDEIHQIYVPGRSAELLDWLADILGSITAVIITKYLLEYLKRTEFEKSK